MKPVFITLVGTRPELIRLSKIIRLLDKQFDHKLVHTGQNFSPELSEIFFSDLGIRTPDYFLNINTSSLGSALGQIMTKFEEVLNEVKPKGLLVLGDTNSALGAIVAKRRQVVVYHWEAGNRSFDSNVPEEINRKLIDHLADINLAYTETARRNLLREGLSERRTFVTGSPMGEVISGNIQKIQNSDVLSRYDLKPGGFLVASFHRQENVDLPSRLEKLANSVNLVAESFNKRVIVTVHPRTKKRLEAIPGIKWGPLVELLNPLNFSDYLSLQMHSMCVLSDSGTISEESAILKFPAVTIRDSMERPEALESGSIVLTGLDGENVIDAIKYVTSNGSASMPEEYGVQDAAHRAMSIILSTLFLSSEWAGMRPFPETTN